MSKHCSECGVTKPLDGFHRDGRSPDGYHYRCKQCRSSWRKENRLKNLDHIRERNAKYMSAYYHAHPEWAKERIHYNSDRNKQLDPDRRKQIVAQSKHTCRENASRSYVVGLLTRHWKGAAASKITDELIELKRAQIHLRRAVKSAIEVATQHKDAT